MSPTSYQTALPRNRGRTLYRPTTLRQDGERSHGTSKQSMPQRRPWPIALTQARDLQYASRVAVTPSIAQVREWINTKSYRRTVKIELPLGPLRELLTKNRRKGA